MGKMAGNKPFVAAYMCLERGKEGGRGGVKSKEEVGSRKKTTKARKGRKEQKEE
jgi:hypothetical protein